MTACSVCLGQPAGMCSRCGGTGDDPELSDCRCDCCSGSGDCDACDGTGVSETPQPAPPAAKCVDECQCDKYRKAHAEPLVKRMMLAWNLLHGWRPHWKPGWWYKPGRDGEPDTWSDNGILRTMGPS